MARSGRSSRKEEPKPAPPMVLNEGLTKRMARAGDNSIPIRTCVYVEVGDMPAKDVQSALATLNAAYNNSHHPVFVLPLRNGKARTDVLFEGEILEVVRNLFEVRGGQIEFKRNPVEVDVLRTQL